MLEKEKIRSTLIPIELVKTELSVATVVIIGPSIATAVLTVTIRLAVLVTAGCFFGGGGAIK
ncbi:7139_t:CDS:2 [Entrophospora sp. SA101]|nr:7139_t:CDS:2 [Entrophospora sp. SA101]